MVATQETCCESDLLLVTRKDSKKKRPIANEKETDC